MNIQSILECTFLGLQIASVALGLFTNRDLKVNTKATEITKKAVQLINGIDDTRQLFRLYNQQVIGEITCLREQLNSLGITNCCETCDPLISEFMNKLDDSSLNSEIKSAIRLLFPS